VIAGGSLRELGREPLTSRAVTCCEVIALLVKRLERDGRCAIPCGGCHAIQSEAYWIKSARCASPMRWLSCSQKQVSQWRSRLESVFPALSFLVYRSCSSLSMAQHDRYTQKLKAGKDGFEDVKCLRSGALSSRAVTCCEVIACLVKRLERESARCAVPHAVAVVQSEAGVAVAQLLESVFPALSFLVYRSCSSPSMASTTALPSRARAPCGPCAASCARRRRRRSIRPGPPR